jgi:GntR family transcriptional regulator
MLMNTKHTNKSNAARQIASKAQHAQESSHVALAGTRATPQKESSALWVDVVRDLRRCIESRVYRVGATLPTELELCDIYGVSRFTIRAALKALQEQGIISRRRNTGTRVEACEFPNLFSESPTSIEDLALYRSDHPRKFVSAQTVIANRALATLLSCPLGDEWVHLSFVRMAEDDPTQGESWIDVYIRPEFENVVQDARKNPRILTSMLLERRHNVRIAAIQQQISAILCSNELATQLGAKRGDAVLRIRRRYIDDESRVVEVSVTSFAAHRYRHTTILRRSDSF